MSGLRGGVERGLSGLVRRQPNQLSFQRRFAILVEEFVINGLEQTVRLYLDDSGSRLPDAIPPIRTDGINCFALGGVLIDEIDVPVAYEMHAEFVKKWNLSGPLHSTKIRGLRDQFRWLGNSPDRVKFFVELEDLLLSVPVIGLACAIDRPCYNDRYKSRYGAERWFMCKTAFSILAERAAKYAIRRGARLKIFYEECGKAEDRDLIKYMKELKSNGMPFDRGSSALYESLSPDQFRKTVIGEPRRLTKKSGIMQLADLYLYPIIKGGYDASYEPYKKLIGAGKLIDCTLEPTQVSALGIKYSCFDFKNTKSPEVSELSGGPQ